MDYSEIVLTVQELIADAGRQIKIQRFSSVSADPEAPWLGVELNEEDSAVAEEYELSAVFVPASGGSLGMEFIREGLFDRVEQVALIPPINNPIDGFHTIIDNDVTWKIEWMEVLKPGPVILLYAIGLKR